MCLHTFAEAFTTWSFQKPKSLQPNVRQKTRYKRFGGDKHTHTYTPDHLSFLRNKLILWSEPTHLTCCSSPTCFNLSQSIIAIVNNCLVFIARARAHRHFQVGFHLFYVLFFWLLPNTP